MIKKQELKLTKNQALVFNALTKAAKPVGAYDLLDELREHGIKAPLQIYRALDRLIELRLAHRLESLNAWTTCCDADHASAAVFVICDDCGNVEEHIDADFSSSVENIAKRSGFAPKRPVFEIHGLCGGCKSAQGLCLSGNNFYSHLIIGHIGIGASPHVGGFGEPCGAQH